MEHFTVISRKSDGLTSSMLPPGKDESQRLLLSSQSIRKPFILSDISNGEDCACVSFTNAITSSVIGPGAFSAVFIILDLHRLPQSLGKVFNALSTFNL
jgi:hypothetical protein